MPPYKLLLTYYLKTKLNGIFRVALKAISWATGVELNYTITLTKFFFIFVTFLTFCNVIYFYLNVFTSVLERCVDGPASFSRRPRTDANATLRLVADWLRTRA